MQYAYQLILLYTVRINVKYEFNLASYPGSPGYKTHEVTEC